MSLLIPDLGKARVLVVGDVMLDRYWHGSTLRISPEAPVPVVRVERCEDRPGGAANVALNLAALGVGTSLLGVIGEDDAARALDVTLRAAGVKTAFLTSPDTPTITKLRVISRHQQLLRLDFEEALDNIAAPDLQARFEAQLDAHDLVVLSDYAKGTLHGAQALIRLARAAGIPVLVDPKNPHVEIYRGATLMTPNMAELEGIVGPCPDEATLSMKGLRLIEHLEQEALLVTRGEHGMTLIVPGQPALHLPSHAREVYDVTGAGDTVIAVLAAALAGGTPLAHSVGLANLAAGIAVSKLGTAAVSAVELTQSAAHQGNLTLGAVTEDQLLAAVKLAKRRGERLVMTNGCFDILHAGHVAYLEEARAMGDRLIVAVNDDDSVRRLKGDGRPVNALNRRMAVLAGLASVDWVVPFSESTPERLICRVLPDVLTKGADYRPEQIAGGDCVRANGGEVCVIGLVEGLSTTSILSSTLQAARAPKENGLFLEKGCHIEN